MTSLYRNTYVKTSDQRPRAREEPWSNYRRIQCCIQLSRAIEFLIVSHKRIQDSSEISIQHAVRGSPIPASHVVSLTALSTHLPLSRTRRRGRLQSSRAVRCLHVWRLHVSRDRQSRPFVAGRGLSQRPLTASGG